MPNGDAAAEPTARRAWRLLDARPGALRAAASRGSSSLRGRSSARCRSSCSRSATDCSCSATTSRSRSSPPASSGTSSRTAATTRRAPSSTSRPPADACRSSCGSTPHNVKPHPTRSRTGRRAPSSRRSTGSRGCGSPTSRRRRCVRSALTLRGLCHEPTGSILAAATMSLPEELGGVRNWDYRYCWLRDAAMSARVLVDLGSLAEAEALLQWVDGCVGRTGGHPERLHPLYTVEGLELGPEAVIETLPGYAGSRPVRVGNAANRQIQLDVFGPIADLVAAVVEARGSVRDEHWRVVEAMVQAVERRWHEPDHGIWEARLPPRHHVYSKVMCWLTVDRALQVQALRGEPPRPDWVELRESIRANVLEHGWNEAAGAYSVAYGDEEIDASSLWIGLSGPRRRRRSAVPRHGAQGRGRAAQRRRRLPLPVGRRPPGTEGGFHICTAWLIEAYLRTGPARRRRGALPADARDGRPDRAAPRAVRPVRRARARQPPAGVQPPRADPLRDRARRRRAQRLDAVDSLRNSAGIVSGLLDAARRRARRCDRAASRPCACRGSARPGARACRSAGRSRPRRSVPTRGRRDSGPWRGRSPRPCGRPRSTGCARART